MVKRGMNRPTISRILLFTLIFSAEIAEVKALPSPKKAHAPPDVNVLTENMTPGEKQAHQLWSLRAALNVAGLQCQFAPFLQTVANYNDFLQQYEVDLQAARKILKSFFRRMSPNAKKGRVAFDQYSTRVYNAFSVVNRQKIFCENASKVGYQSLSLSSRKILTNASHQVGAIKATTPLPERQKNNLGKITLDWVSLPVYQNFCTSNTESKKSDHDHIAFCD